MILRFGGSDLVGDRFDLKLRVESRSAEIPASALAGIFSADTAAQTRSASMANEREVLPE